MVDGKVSETAEPESSVSVRSVRVIEPPLPAKAYAEYEIVLDGNVCYKRWSQCAHFGEQLRQSRGSAMPDFPFDAHELVVDLRSTELVARLPFIGQALSPASAQRENLSPAFLEWRRRGLKIYLVQIAPVAHAELDAWLEDKGPAPRSSFSVLSDALPMTPTTAQLPNNDVVMGEAVARLEFEGKATEEVPPAAEEGVPASLLTHLLTCLLAYLLTCLLAYLLTCLLRACQRARVRAWAMTASWTSR